MTFSIVKFNKTEFQIVFDCHNLARNLCLMDDFKNCV